MDPSLRVMLQKADEINKPAVNVRAAIAYLYTRMAKFELKSVRSEIDKNVYQYKVVAGDSLWKIAKKVGTTQDEMKQSNPKTSERPLQIGQTLIYRKASMERLIVGWRPLQTSTIALRYNGGGDPEYSAKLNYILNNVMPKLKRGKP